jgi:hypothetical protein
MAQSLGGAGRCANLTEVLDKSQRRDAQGRPLG